MMDGSVPKSLTEYSEKCATVLCCLRVCRVFEVQNSLEFSTNVDITSYKDGKRYTHNPDGRAVPQVVWDCFEVSIKSSIDLIHLRLLPGWVFHTAP